MTVIDPFAKEHHEIMEILKRLHPGSHGQSVMTRLIDHLSTHFVEEDIIMRNTSYPGRDDHADDHFLIQDMFLAHLSRINSGNITREELDMLAKRMQDHIATVDRRLFEWLDQHHPEVLHRT